MVGLPTEPAEAGRRRRAGLTPATVVDAALAVVDGAGAEGLTLAAVATAVGVASPSLYKHVGGLADVRRLVALRIQDDVAGSLRDAVVGKATDDAVRALSRAYRGYLRRYPKRHPFLVAADTDVFVAVLRGYRLEGADLVHATRCLRSAVQGFAVLEALGGFGRPESIDDSFQRLIDMFTRWIVKS